ncbi:MAG: phage holin family protein [Staphylococcus sp.]|nr:phage holin family protein [Staphylococcus sp.]
MLTLLIIYYTAVLVAVVADLASGLRKARIRGEKCSSSGLRRTVDKIGRYYIALFSMTVIDIMIVSALNHLSASGTDLIPPFPYLSTLGAVALALIELKSIFESADEKGDMRRTIRELISLLTRLKLK